MSDETQGNERAKIRLLLTQSELETLDRAVRESGALTRTLLIFEAIQAGLQNPTPKITSKKRNRRVDTWASGDLKRRIAQLANDAGVTQQTLLRHFLHTYLTAAPWKEATLTHKPSPNPNRKQKRKGG